jgi:hypothetical protein
MKLRVPKHSLWFFVFILLIVCGCTAALQQQKEGMAAAYIGYLDGKYVRLYYRVEDSVLSLAVQNISILPLYQVILSVEQKTAAGSSEGQSFIRLLRKSQIHNMNFNIPANASGEVVFTCYFETTAPSPDMLLKEYLDDRIVLHLNLP